MIVLSLEVKGVLEREGGREGGGGEGEGGRGEWGEWGEGGREGGRDKRRGEGKINVYNFSLTQANNVCCCFSFGEHDHTNRWYL